MTETLQQRVAGYSLTLAKGEAPSPDSDLSPVLIEAASNKEIVIDERRLELAKRRWDTAIIDQRAVQAVIGPESRALDVVSLRQLIADDAIVHDLRKTALNQSPNICLGRAKRNDVRIDDPSISSLHAGFEEDDGGYNILDLGSRNGTFVNRHRVPLGTCVRLLDGDCVRMGKRVFYYVSGSQLLELLKAYVDG